MADYFRVEPRFWSGTTGRQIRALPYEVRIVAMYLMTGPTASSFGLYYLPFPTLVHETGVPEDDAAAAIAALRSIGFADYDEVHEVVWIPEMARIQIGDEIGRTDKRWKWAQKQADALASMPFYDEFMVRYQDAYNITRRKIRANEAPSKGLPEKKTTADTPSMPSQPLPNPTASLRNPSQPHTQPEPESRARESASPTNEQIASRWDAAMRGLGLKVACGSIGYHHAELLFRRSQSDAEAEAVAKHFRASLSAGINASPAKFVADYPIRVAHWMNSLEPPATTGGITRCETHPGGPYDRKGNCERCASARNDTATPAEGRIGPDVAPAGLRAPEAAETRVAKGVA